MTNINSFDPLMWANPENKFEQPCKEAVQLTTPSAQAPLDGELAKATAVAEKLLSMGANIAESYDDYLQLGFALANGLGADGRDLYHRLCAQSSKYCEADCEKKWQECLSKNDGRTTIASFYHMAQQAGIDLTEIGRQFPANPQFPQDAGKGLTGQNSTIYEDSAILPQPEGTAGLRETFSDKIDIDRLPPLLRDAALSQPDAESRDKMLLAVLNCLSGVVPNLYGVYDKRRVYAPFYTIISAPPASDKGLLASCRQLLMPVQQLLDVENERAQADYQQQLAEYAAQDKKTRATSAPPKEPPYRSVFIPANSSATATYQALSDNHGWGVVFETEADTLTQALKSDYGDYSDGLRKAFHHEYIGYNRRKDQERVNIYCPRLAVLLTCTPGQIPSLLPSCENGLGSRFVFYNLSRRLYWRNVFERTDQTLDDLMLQLGQRYLKLYQALLQYNDHPLEFVLSQEQQAEFNRFFEGLQEEQVHLYGDDLIAFVRRLGLVSFRIAMLLTLLHHEQLEPQFDPLSQTLVCSDLDFHTAMTIVNCLINHTAHVYINLVPHNDKPVTTAGNMSAIEKRFFDLLPTDFTTADGKQQAQQLNIPWRTAERYLANLLTRHHLVKRIQNGKYQKL